MSTAAGPRVLIGSSTEAEDLAVELGDALKREGLLAVDHWRDIFTPGKTAIETLEEAVGRYDFAVFLAHADDMTDRRGSHIWTTRDNVVLEFGMFLGKLGRSRCFLLVPDDFQAPPPSDLNGLTVYTWSSQDRAKPAVAVRTAAMRLRQALLSLGRRERTICSNLLTRDDLGRLFPSSTARIDAAEHELLISGNDCAHIVHSETPAIRRALEREVSVKLMCGDPLAASVSSMLVDVDPRFVKPGDFEESMDGVTTQLRKLKEAYPDFFEYRFLPVLPAIGFFFVDPSIGGFMKIELYTPKPWAPINSRPHLYLSPEDDLWRSYFVASWENYWNLARTD